MSSTEGQAAYTNLRRPGTDRWIRVGERERRLLQALTDVSFEHLLEQFQAVFTADELRYALSRFDELGLLTSPLHIAKGYSHPREVLPPRVLRGFIQVVLLSLAATLVIMPLVVWNPVNPPALVLLILVAVSAIAHEIGHALAGRACRLRVDRYGVAFLGLIPVLYVRLRGLWGVPKPQRLAITGAGIATQVIIASLALSIWTLWTWADSAPEALLRFAGLNILLAFVNLLPLSPLDGYWLLAQWLDRPNLREESKTYARLHRVAMTVLQLAIGLSLIQLLVV